MKTFSRCALIIICLGLGIFGYICLNCSKTETKLVTVKVHSGDTLWSICDRVGTEYNPKQDVREIIFYARKINKFDTKILIQPGQKITIPVEVKK